MFNHDAPSVTVELWIGEATFPRSKAFRTNHDRLCVYSADSGTGDPAYQRWFQPGEWTHARSGDQMFTATTPPWPVKR